MSAIDDSLSAGSTVLIAIEDDPARAHGLAAVFRGWRGVTFAIAPSIGTARSMLRSARVHAVLLSTRMSRRAGEAACRTLADSDAGVRIVWLIDDQDVVGYDQALEAGVAGVYYRDQLWPPAAFLRRIGVTPTQGHGDDDTTLPLGLRPGEGPQAVLPPDVEAKSVETDDESARLEALRRYAILDTPREPAFDRITRLAARALGTPVAALSLIDAERLWFKASHGLDLQELPRNGSLCDFTIHHDTVLVVPDASSDARFANNPLIVGPPHIRFYVGVPLTTEDGHRIGTLCVIDSRARASDGFDVAPLVDLADVTIELIRLRSKRSRLIREVAERQQSEAALRQSERRFRDFAETASDWFWEMDDQLRFSYFSERYTDQTGEAVTDRLGRRRDEVALRMPGDDDWDAHLEDLEARREFRSFVYAYQHRNGQLRYAESSGKPIFDDHGRFLGYRGSARDITRRRRAEEQIRHLALHDPLTGLPNRRLFHDRLDRALAAATRSQDRVATMMLDLDRFKDVNDRFGHGGGDRVLQDFATRMGRRLRTSDTLARMGGDEFAIVQAGVRDADGVARLAKDIVRAMSRPFVLDGAEVDLGISIGIAVHPGDGETSDSLLKSADMALYRAKQAGRNCWRFHETPGVGPEELAG